MKVQRLRFCLENWTFEGIFDIIIRSYLNINEDKTQNEKRGL